jgi:hypothetical protein
MSQTRASVAGLLTLSSQKFIIIIIIDKTALFEP